MELISRQSFIYYKVNTECILDFQIQIVHANSESK